VIVILDSANRPISFGETAEELLQSFAETVLDQNPTKISFRNANTLTRQGNRVSIPGIPKVAVCVDAGFPLHPNQDMLDLYESDEMDLFCGPAADILSDKRLLAWLSEEAPQRGTLAEDDAQLVSRLLPWTRIARRGPVSWQGTTTDFETLFATHRDDLVLKPGDGLQGVDVFVGSSCDTSTWEVAVRRAIEESWVVQKKVESTRRPLFSRETEGVAPYRVVWGAYVVDGRGAGLYPRVLAESRGAVVNVAQGGEYALAFEVDDAA
jgi:hypothetical protein